MNTDSVLAGIASSALGVRRGLAVEWGCGLYLSDRRLVITKEVVGTHFGQDANGAALLGSFTTKVDTFFDRKQKSLEELAQSSKKLDVDQSEITSIALKKPGVFQSGSIDFKLRSGKNFKLFVADRAAAYSEEAFAAIREIVSTHFSLPVIEN
ncbi:MAG: hypothetical protein ACHQ1H_03710 [Nitrososphaerales archaeon]